MRNLFIQFTLLLLPFFAIAQSLEVEDGVTNKKAEDKLNEPSSDQVGPLPLEQLRRFANVYMRIKQNYVKDVSDETLLEYAIKGMLKGLDPHSVYLKEERFENLNEETQGKFGGLGLEVVMENGLVKVVAPIDDTPAAKAGLKSGDLIIRIDGKSLTGGTLNEATEKMRGDPGTEISLTVLRETEAEPIEFKFKRAVIKISSVRRVELSDAIGYLRVSQFQLNTATDFRKQLKKIREKPSFGGLIIDLRNNPGGLLNSAISIADAFVREGVLVSTRGRTQDKHHEYMASANDMLSGKPIVVLINEGSASASEIVAGALQDHNRALIMGKQSFGKGSVQTVMELDDTQAIKLTTARYFTPSGRSIQAEGIVPDIEVEAREFKTPEEVTYHRVKEKDLDGHLENQERKTLGQQASELQSLLANDYQLNEAYNLLSGMLLFDQHADVSQTPAD